LLRSVAPADVVQEALPDLAVFEHEYDYAESFQIMAFREQGTIRLELRRITDRS